MKFWEAMKALEEGKKVRVDQWELVAFPPEEDGSHSRPIWPETSYIQLIGGELRDQEGKPASFSGSAYLGCNWAIYQEKRELSWEEIEDAVYNNADNPNYEVDFKSLKKDLGFK